MGFAVTILTLPRYDWQAHGKEKRHIQEKKNTGSHHSGYRGKKHLSLIVTIITVFSLPPRLLRGRHGSLIRTCVSVPLVAFSSLARILGRICSTIHSPSALFFSFFLGPGDQLAHTNSTLHARSNQQWLNA